MRSVVVGAHAAALSAVASVLAGPAQADAVGPVVPPVRACAELVGNYAIRGAPTHVESAAPVAAAGNEPAHCDVRGYVEPAVRFRLRLPTETYSGRYLQHGCPGQCGVIIEAPPDCGPRDADLALAATDNGHVGAGEFPSNIMDSSWAADDQAARDDFFFRAPHVVSLAAKRVISQFYGAPPKRSYFSGCSTGGREGLLLAQRYPHDFDGITVGSAGNLMGPLHGVYMAFVATVNNDAAGRPILTAAKLPALHEAVLSECDGIDGLVDGQIDDPRACRFDPAALACPPGEDTSTCLTPAQVTSVRGLYEGPKDARGVRLYPGWQTRGSELSWEGHLIPTEFSAMAPVPDGYLKYMGFPIGTPHSSLASARFTVEELRRLTPEGVKGNAMSLDMREFHRSGGKLIMWTGWDDQSVPAVATLDYYQRLWRRSGGLGATQEWLRTFMVPSMYHAWTGGSRLTGFDTFDALVAWVERGDAPSRVVATGTNPLGEPRTRPVYPYPLVARYDGTGSVDDARNFGPFRPPGRLRDIIDWAGVDLYYRPGPVAR